MTKSCIDCENCDPKRINDLGQVRCKRFSTFVNCYSDCDYFANKVYDDFLSELCEVTEKEREMNGV